MNSQAKKKTADELAKILATTYCLYLKTQNFHWNVTGPHFHDLHSLFQSQYEALSEAVDEIAERIRALGHPAPGSFSAFSKISSIKDSSGNPKAKEMVKVLLSDHETAAECAKEVLDAAQAAGDDVTVDMMVERIQEHDKTAWMLKSILA